MTRFIYAPWGITVADGLSTIPPKVSQLAPSGILASHLKVFVQNGEPKPR